MNSISLCVSNPLLYVKCFVLLFCYSTTSKILPLPIASSLYAHSYNFRVEQAMCVCVAYSCCCKWPIRIWLTVLFVVSHLIITIARQYERFLLCALCATQVITWCQHRHRHRHQHRHYRSITAVTVCVVAQWFRERNTVLNCLVWGYKRQHKISSRQQSSYCLYCVRNESYLSVCFVQKKKILN